MWWLTVLGTFASVLGAIFSVVGAWKAFGYLQKAFEVSSLDERLSKVTIVIEKGNEGLRKIRNWMGKNISGKEKNQFVKLVDELSEEFMQNSHVCQTKKSIQTEITDLKKEIGKVNAGQIPSATIILIKGKVSKITNGFIIEGNKIRERKVSFIKSFFKV